MLPSYFNRYSYTANDPINAVDPDGEFWGAVIGVAVYAATSYISGEEMTVSGTLIAAGSGLVGAGLAGQASNLAKAIGTQFLRNSAKTGAYMAETAVVHGAAHVTGNAAAGAATGALQQVANNGVAIASGEEDVGLLDGVGDSAKAGAISGAVAGSGGASAAAGGLSGAVDDVAGAFTEIADAMVREHEDD